ncbi:MAG: restriction endonuclease subunit S [Myxococcales bacterium]|nr:restriction endonuclease subunit S [Myxococcales bacterium]
MTEATVLPPGWRSCVLDDLKADVANAIVGGPFGSELVRADYVEDGVPVIRGTNLGTGERRFYTDDFVYVSDAKADDLGRHIARPGDVVVTQRGTLGQVGLVPAGTRWPRFLLSQSQMKLTCDPARADPEYIYYWMLTPEVRDYTERHAITTGVPHTNLAILRQTPVRLPPPGQQRAIARALGAIDERIVVCETQSDELDRLARLVFRAWFVEFAPAYANRDDTTHESVDNLEQVLFPDHLIHTDQLGRIPHNWTPTPLASLAAFNNGTAFAAADLCARTHPNGRPIIKIGEIKRGITAQTQYAHNPRRARPIDDGALLMSWSGNPQTSIGTFLWYGGPGWLNQHIFHVEPPAPHWRAYTYCLLRELQPRFVEFARSKQTTGLGHVTQADLRALHVARPPEPVVKAFDRRVAPVFARIAANGHNLRELVRARHHLLLALTRGQLTAPS